MIKRLKLYWLMIRKKVEKYPVSNPEIKELLKKKFKNCVIEVEDVIYYTCDYQTAKNLASLIPLKFRKWKKNEYDCDNFSKSFWALVGELFPRLPVGRCNVKTSKGLHSLNFIIYKTGSRLSFSFIEPQTGLIRYFNYQPYIMLI